MKRTRLPKEERMLMIRNHAKDVFLSKGFEKTTMEDVIKASGMSKGGVYRHYGSTIEMLYDLMMDGNLYRENLIEDYLKNNKGEDKFEQMGEILVDKTLASNDLTKLYVMFLKSKKYNEELEILYQDLEEIAKEQLGFIAKKLGIKADIFEDKFLVHYMNSLILSTELLNARESFNSQREFFKKIIVNYIRDLEKRVEKGNKTGIERKE